MFGNTFVGKTPLTVPVTNGLTNVQLLQRQTVKPKKLAQRGGSLSNDFGMIPNLRNTTSKKKKVMSLRKF